MKHALVIGLFDSPSAAATAAHALRTMGISRERVSIVARSHDEEGEVAERAGASPGSEIEDSRLASRLGELSAHLIAAAALVLPGIGPIVAIGPLSAGLGEAAGHLAGGIATALERVGMASADAARWEAAIEAGAVLVGAHVDPADVQGVRTRLRTLGASDTAQGAWPD